MKKLVLFLLLLLPFGGWAQAFEGSWTGRLSMGNISLRIVFHISKSGDAYTATMDSPDQGAVGVPVAQTAVTEGVLRMEIPAIHFVYEGRMTADDEINGHFTQMGNKLELNLVRAKEPVLKRPQTPVAPFPYEEREITFASREAGVELHGTLTLPREKAPVALVVLVTGSGTQNRDEELFGHKPFAVIADYLTRHDIGVLRYDDRMFGADAQSVEPTTENLAEDALGAVDYLAAMPEYRKTRIGILGHSEGGTIAFMSAARSKRVSFIISLAGSMLRGDRVLMEQNRFALLQKELPRTTAGQAVNVLERIFTIARTHSLDELRAHAEEFKAQIEHCPEMEPLPQSLRKPLLKTYDAVASSAWLHHFVGFDPERDIRKSARCAILALNGDRDVQVDADEHLGRLRKLLPHSRKLTTKHYPDLNHLFQPCELGLVSEYATIETTISPEVLHDIAAWISALK